MKELFIIAGRPCSGKTSLTYKLSQKYKIHAEYLDVFAAKAVDQATKDSPELYRWQGWQMVSILSKDPKVLFKEYQGFYRELYPLVEDFILDRKEEQLILESSFFLPEHVKKLQGLFDVRVIYLKTSDDFVRERYVKRDYAVAMAQEDGGQQALENLLQRDRIFADYMYRQAQLNGYEIINLSNDQDFERLYNDLSYRWFS